MLEIRQSFSYGRIIITVLFLLLAFNSCMRMNPFHHSFCQNCHEMHVVYRGWEGSLHRAEGVDCFDCHTEPGVIKHFEASLTRGIKDGAYHIAYSQERIQEILETERAEVFTHSCRSCHPPGLEQPDSTQYVARHDDHLRSPEMDCHDCHTNIGHFSRDKKAFGLEKSRCLKCHASETASPQANDCAGCHPLQENFLRGKAIPGHTVVNEDMVILQCVNCHQKDVYNEVDREGCVKCHLPEEEILEKTAAVKETTAKHLAAYQKIFDELGEFSGDAGPYPAAVSQKLAYHLDLFFKLSNDGSLGVHNPLLTKEILPQIEGALREAFQQMGKPFLLSD